MLDDKLSVILGDGLAFDSGWLFLVATAMATLSRWLQLEWSRAVLIEG